jgi:hypothetical protein
LPNGAELYFLGTNANTAQGYHGDTYLDEYFWIHKFLEFRKVTSGMAMHKKWKQTYFSTPSSITHEAYDFWTGDLFNKKRPKNKRVQMDVSHEALARGRLCEDRQWRQIVTVEDALRGGCDLFDPTPVLNAYDFLYSGCWSYGSRYYEPPVDFNALAKLYRATAHHGSALQVKRNILLRTFEPTPFLNRSNFTRLALDLLVFGNLYAEQVRSQLGRLMRIEPALVVE